MDPDDTEREGFPPFTFFGWEDYIGYIATIASEVAASEINLEQRRD